MSISGTTPENILIAGCGDLGTAVGLRLADQGHHTYGLRRRQAPLPPPLHTLHADLTSPETLSVIPDQIDLIYYIATPDRYDDPSYQAAYVAGLDNLLHALKRQQQSPRRLLLVSSTTVYGQLNGEWVDETSPTEPSSFSGKRMLESEQLALAGNIPVSIIRFGGIYGPGRERMIRRTRAGEPCAAEPALYTNRIHRDDCVRALIHLAEPTTPTGIYLGVDDAPCTQCELMDWLAQQLDLPQPKRIQAAPGGTRGSNKRCRNGKLKATGCKFSYPTYQEGCKPLLDP